MLRRSTGTGETSTRRLTTNVADAHRFGKAPMNQFATVPAFPDDRFKAVVRPNADTLYSFLWFDVSKEPILVHIAASGGRYYLMPTLDIWTDVFDFVGNRTTGTVEQVVAIAAPGWQGTLPENVTLIHSPTATGKIQKLALRARLGNHFLDATRSTS
jgi:hypothetical protein